MPSDDMPWFADWLTSHMRTCPHGAFPHPRTNPEGFRDLAILWKGVFLKRSVTRAEALEASATLAERGSVFPDEQLHALLEIINGRRRSLQHAREAADRRDLRERSAASRDEDRRAREAFDALPEAERQAIRDEVIRENPALADAARWVCLLAIEKFKEREAAK